jgi:hypothetical protein
MLVAGGGLAFAYYIRRRRPGEPVTENWAARYPPPPPMAGDQQIATDRGLAMEAELNELMSEARALELSAEALSHAEPPD